MTRCCFLGRRRFHLLKCFWKIQPFFSEKAVQFPFADSLHVLPMSGDGPSLTCPFSLYVMSVCFPRGPCFECVCLVSHCLPYWLLYSSPSEFAACFISLLHLHSASLCLFCLSNLLRVSILLKRETAEGKSKHWKPEIKSYWQQKEHEKAIKSICKPRINKAGTGLQKLHNFFPQT